jgi:hypothetical protein
MDELQEDNVAPEYHIDEAVIENNKASRNVKDNQKEQGEQVITEARKYNQA